MGRGRGRGRGRRRGEGGGGRGGGEGRELTVSDSKLSNLLLNFGGSSCNANEVRVRVG